MKAYLVVTAMTDTQIRDSSKRDESIRHILRFCNLYEIEHDVLRMLLNRLVNRQFSDNKILEPRPHIPQAYKATRALLHFMKPTGFNDRLQAPRYRQPHVFTLMAPSSIPLLCFLIINSLYL